MTACPLGDFAAQSEELAKSRGCAFPRATVQTSRTFLNLCPRRSRYFHTPYWGADGPRLYGYYERIGSSFIAWTWLIGYGI